MMMTAGVGAEAVTCSANEKAPASVDWPGPKAPCGDRHLVKPPARGKRRPANSTLIRGRPDFRLVVGNQFSTFSIGDAGSCLLTHALLTDRPQGLCSGLAGGRWYVAHGAQHQRPLTADKRKPRRARGGRRGCVA